MVKRGKKSILAILLALCIVCSMGVLAACGDEEDKSVTYTVTVLKDDGSAASGVKVTPKKGSTMFETKTTDAKGKATFSLASDTYTVTIKNLPENYTLPSDATLTLTAKNPSLTVTLARITPYTIHLVTQDNVPFTAQEIGVGICTLDGHCLNPVTPDANGTATIQAAKGGYHVQIIGLEGYAYENDANGYYVEELSATVTELTVKIYPAPEVIGTEMMPDEKEAFYNEASAAYVYGYDKTKTAYRFAAKSVAAGKYAYYTITPTISGNYNLYRLDGLTYYKNDTFKAEPAAASAIGSAQALTLEAGKTYYIAAKNESNAAVTTNAVITAPESTYLTFSGVSGTLDLTVGKALTNAIIDFNPPSAGAYKLTVQGSTPAIVKASFSTPSSEIYMAPNPEDYVAGASATEYYSTFDRDATPKSHLYFAVTVQVTSSDPVNITVKLEKIAEANDTNTTATAHDLATYAPDTTGKELFGIPMNGTAQLVYDSVNDRYTYDGKEVVVMLKKNIDSSRFSKGYPLAYMDQKDSAFRPNYVITTAVAEGYGLNRVNYYDFVRGFTEYDIQQNGPLTTVNIPANLDTQNCYTNYANADGVYPLTQELRTFLEAFYAQNAGLIGSFIAATDNASKWMFPLYYYDTAIVADQIVGEYELVSIVDDQEDKQTVANGDLERDDYLLTVTKTNGFTLTYYDEDTWGQEALYTGTWEKSATGENSYTFTVENGTMDGETTWIDLHFTVTYNPTAHTLTLVAVESPLDGPTEFVFVVYVDEIVGVYTEDAMMNAKTLTVNADGTWDNGELSGTWVNNGDDTYTFTVPAEGDWSEENYTVTLGEESSVVTLTMTDGNDNSTTYNKQADED